MAVIVVGKMAVIVVGDNSKYFTIAWYHVSKFYLKPNNLAYEHSKSDYLDFVDSDDVHSLTWNSNIVIEEIIELETNFEPESKPIQGDQPLINIYTQDDTYYIPQQREQAWDNVDWRDFLEGDEVDVSSSWDENFIDSFVRRSGNEGLTPEVEGEGK
ncbi:hypothetical protein Fot_15390 [Forsythia ovata]|uniref:Uncharacterized protein n=1 Tax=Forsythia ovata TaxID=205694 RepID=A0ABD1W9B1_9LAMI